MKRVAVGVAALVLAASCASEGLTLLPDSELPQDVYGSPRPTPAETPEQLPRTGLVYLVREDRLHPVRSRLPGTARSLPEALLLALLGARPEDGATTAIPPETVPNAVEVEGNIVTVDLSEEFERPAPIREQALRIAQVVFTLTGPDSGILAVQFRIDGVSRRVIGDVNLSVQDRPVSRGDYGQFRPPEDQA